MSTDKAEQRAKVLFAVLAFVNSVWVFLTYLSLNRIGTLEPATLARILEGTAERPYIYRVLIPLFSRILAPLVPTQFIQWLYSAPTSLRNAFGWLSEGGYERQAAVILILMFLSLFAFAFAEKRFLEVLGTGRKEQYVLSLLAQICILPLSFQFAYFYDLPQIVLVTLCLIFLYRENWWLYAITLALASLNKETSLFVIAVFVVYFLPKLPLRKFMGLLAVQIIIYAVIRGNLLYIFRNNPGTAVLLTLEGHYKQYTTYPSTLIFTLIFFMGLGFLIAKDWSHKHPFLRATIVVPLLILVLFFTSGMPMEFRVFLDALPALVILGFPPSAAALQNTTTTPKQIVVK